MANFRVCFLGVSAALPAFDRWPSAQIVEHNHRFFLIDCGEGTQIQLMKNRIRLNRLDAIFISHLHGDHIFGLPGLLSSMSMSNRLDPLFIFGPKGLKTWLDLTFNISQSYLCYPLEINELDETLQPCTTVFQNTNLLVQTIPLNHRIYCNGYIFLEKPKKKPFLFNKAVGDNIPKEFYQLIKQEISFELPDGRFIEPLEYLSKAPKSFAYAYCSDTRYDPSIVPYLRGVNVLYHEATYLHDQVNKAIETCHSTAREAAEIAKAAEVDALFLGHYSARYEQLEGHFQEANAIFPRSFLAFQGNWIDINSYKTEL